MSDDLSSHRSVGGGVWVWVLSLALLFGLPIGLQSVGIQDAEAGSYRYWTYWTSTGGNWTFSPVGPASSVPADGAVEGWRFAVTQTAPTAADQPRIAGSQAFDQFCGQTKSVSNMKRVGVVLDYGIEADRPPGGRSPRPPRGTCVVVAKNATGAAVLSKAASPRIGSGMICGIDGYPTSGCAEPVSASTPKPAKTPQDRKTSAPKRKVASSPGPSSKPKTSTGASSGATGATSMPSATPSPASTTKESKSTPTKSKSASPSATESASPSQSAPNEEPTFVAQAAATEDPNDSRGAPWLQILAVLGIAGLIALAVWRTKTR